MQETERHVVLQYVVLNNFEMLKINPTFPSVQLYIDKLDNVP
jgi:hypothetical protein